MMRMKNYTLVGLSLLVLSACNPEGNIDPKIVERLQTPCNGKVHSKFHETDTGWTLMVTCADEAAIKAKREKFKGDPIKTIKPRTDGYDPLSFGTDK